MAVINNSIQTALRNLGQVNFALNRSLEKLATGFRINRGADDPAGLISSERLNSALASLEAESQALQRMDAVATVADGALSEISSQLTEVSALELRLANTSGLSAGEADAIRMERDSILSSVNRTASTAQFNGQSLFNGEVSFSVGTQALDLPVVNNSNLGETDISGTTFRLSDVGSGGALENNPTDSQDVIYSAISDINTLRGEIGSFQKNAVRSRVNSNHTAIENISAASSVIRDTDFAAETANLGRLAILQKASVGAVTKTLLSSSMVLDLLGK